MRVTAPATPTVSLVVTVRDEASSIDALLASVAAQTRLPDEIVIVDGGSTDDTLQRLARWRDRLPLRVLCEPGANISQGRNRGIAASASAGPGALIAVTDAGVRLDPGWLAALVAPLLAADGPEVAGGFFVPDPQTPFEVAMGATVLPTLADITPATFLPSSRSIAFRRAAWERCGGYPEWLDYCEDLIFDLRLRACGARFVFVPEAIARFRPRGSYRAFWRQYFHYARGDGKAGLFARRHAIRYATYAGLLWFLLRGRRRPLLWLPVVLAAAAYLRRPYARLAARQWSAGALPGTAVATTGVHARHNTRWRGLDAPIVLASVPLIRLAGDLAKMAGYPVGLWWRWRRYGLRRGWRSIDG